ncbi:MAG: BON domain-containing protein [Gammaproteobacteria bacterium]|nr:BON domain-containing protein [Gammaproteobacteria bacterium]MDD9896321.1 BON domain-containing protein [Gammaproteobacteria bacterium]MDD9959228.1 BON domain-containing protein [Gammaproteobacteria bacterium]
MASSFLNKLSKISLVSFFSLLLLVACGGESSAPESSATSTPSNVSEADMAVDANIKAQVESALANALDLPQGFTVDVSEGVVLISGSMVCEDCGGMRTPGNIGTIQQSLGGVVRAVPGVMRVDFDLSYGSE